jgi:hypothetical protein
MQILAWVDDSLWTCPALQFVCRHLVPEDELVLLAVCERAGEGYLECGRMLLKRAVWACAGTLVEAPLRLRLAVGAPRAVVPRVAAEERAELVVTGSAETDERRHGPSLGDTDGIAQTRGLRPLLVGSPDGIVLLTGEEDLLVARWRDVGTLSELQPTSASHGGERTGQPEEGVMLR